MSGGRPTDRQVIEQVLAKKRMNAVDIIDTWRTSEMTEMVIGAVG